MIVLLPVSEFHAKSLNCDHWDDFTTTEKALVLARTKGETARLSRELEKAKNREDRQVQLTVLNPIQLPHFL